jgi:hypothetical protein
LAWIGAGNDNQGRLIRQVALDCGLELRQVEEAAQVKNGSPRNQIEKSSACQTP